MSKKLVVHKFVFPASQCMFELPLNAQVLSVGVQNNDIVMWVLLDPDLDATKKPRYFGAINTGVEWDVKDKLYEFIGTVTVEDIVWHIFEVTKKPQCINPGHDAQVRAGQRCMGCLETE